MKWLYEKLTAWILSFFLSLREFGENLLGGLIDTCSAWIPGLENVTAITPYLAQINYIFPLSETVALLWTYYGLWSFLKAWNYVKRWIPFV